MSAEQPMDELSPKEKFDLTMKQAREANAQARGDEPEDAEEDLSAFEEEDELEEDDEGETEGPVDIKEFIGSPEETRTIDKNLGEEKLPVTEMSIGDHQKMKVAEAQKNAMAGLRALKDASQTHMKPEQIRIVQNIVADVANGIITDPVLVHLVNQKAKQVQLFKDAQAAIGRLQQRLLNDISTATNDVVKCKGAIESIDAQILEVAADTKQG